MCRIYLTATLGVFAPLSAWLALFILDSGRSHRHRRPTVAASPAPAPAHEEGRTGVEAYRTTNYDRSYTTSLRSFRSMQNKTSKKSILLLNFRIVSLALLCTLPILLLQTAVAWISIWVKWDNQDFEEQPRSVLGFFLATFWYGNGPHECGDVATATDNNNNNNNTQECIACVFPAAAAVLHLLWTLAFIISLWNVSHRLSESAINLKIKRRLRVFVVVYTLIAALGKEFLGL